MADERQRELHRIAVRGTEADEARWLLERVRSGDLRRTALAGAALLGYPAAELALAELQSTGEASPVRLGDPVRAVNLPIARAFRLGERHVAELTVRGRYPMVPTPAALEVSAVGFADEAVAVVRLTRGDLAAPQVVTGGNPTCEVCGAAADRRTTSEGVETDFAVERRLSDEGWHQSADGVWRCGVHA